MDEGADKNGNEAGNGKSVAGGGFADRVGAKADRLLKARRHPPQVVWFGLGMMGLIGWSVAIPTVTGALLGIWLDAHRPGGRSWTLALLAAGLVLGCANAWRWVAKEEKEMRREREDDDA